MSRTVRGPAAFLNRCAATSVPLNPAPTMAISMGNDLFAVPLAGNAKTGPVPPQRTEVAPIMIGSSGSMGLVDPRTRTEATLSSRSPPKTSRIDAPEAYRKKGRVTTLGRPRSSPLTKRGQLQECTCDTKLYVVCFVETHAGGWSNELLSKPLARRHRGLGHRPPGPLEVVISHVSICATCPMWPNGEPPPRGAPA
jgi:hypothetical protein